MVSCEIIQGPTPQNQERSRRRFGDRRGRGEHGDLRAPPERLSAPGIDDVAQHRRSEPRRLTPRSRRRACLFVERELAGEATFGMAQDDPPSASGRVSDRDEARLSEVEDGGSAATTPEASRDAVQSYPLADGAEVDRHALRRQGNPGAVDRDRAPADEPTCTLHLTRRGWPATASGVPPQPRQRSEGWIEGASGPFRQAASNGDGRRESSRDQADGISGEAIQAADVARRRVVAHHPFPCGRGSECGRPVRPARNTAGWQRHGEERAHPGSHMGHHWRGLIGGLRWLGARRSPCGRLVRWLAPTASRPRCCGCPDREARRREAPCHDTGRGTAGP